MGRTQIKIWCIVISVVILIDQPTHVVPVECVKPFKLNTGPRLALSRTEIVEQLYEEHGLQDW